jgi:hypothetical protein
MAEEKVKKKNQWIPIIAAGLSTLLVTVIAALIVNAILNKQPKLSFSFSPTSSFQGTNQNIAIYDVSIFNSGKVPISDLVSHAL